MEYAIIPQNISQSERAEINAHILSAIDNGDKTVSEETIYNTYTGLGGLHGLRQKDFSSYNAYAKAKQKLELGQFFTPHALCRDIVEMLAPDPSEMVLDMGCGIGNFFNFLPNQYNAYGFDIDPKAVKVAKHLYPHADIRIEDITRYEPQQRYDILLGNPPYNLQFDHDLSQFYYCKKAYAALNPAAIMALVVPVSFMESEFWDKSQVRAVENKFSFIGQSRLSSDLFAASGVENYATKVMVFSRESSHIPSNPYKEDEFIGFDELRSRVADFRQLKQSMKLKLRQETRSLLYAEGEAFDYKVNKYLYEIKTQPALRDKYEQSIALVSKFRNQKPPEDANDTQYAYYQHSKLTPAKVLAVLRRYIRQQDYVPRREVALIKTSYTYKLKAYAPHLIDDIKYREVPIFKLIAGDAALPDAGEWMDDKMRQQYRQAMKLIERKRKEYMRQTKPYREMEQNPTIAEYIDNIFFYNKDMERCRFTPLQKHDMNLILQKRYNILNWQQGSGKTAVAYHFAKYIRSAKHVRNIIVAAPAIAIEMTWEPFLRQQKKRFVKVKEPCDLDNIQPGVFIIVSITMLARLESKFKRFIRSHSNKHCLIFDESDELTNETSMRTQRSLNLFRRLKYKILTTGTMTRNNVAEQYGQLALIYNNSYNMICRCPQVYHQDFITHDIIEEPNMNIGEPFPAYGGASLFKACFNPTKMTVFGIQKHNQDIYNINYLREINGYSVLTRRFKEFAGDKYSITTHKVMPSAAEKEVYRKILQEFCTICEVYFSSTGDRKKDAALKLIRQIQLLIRACSIPNKMKGYDGEPFPNKTRYIADLVRGIDTKVAIGTTTLSALEMYSDYMGLAFPQRQVFNISGETSFKRRKTIIDTFEKTADGILVCTQQALKSSVNIPACDDVILESLLWNIARMEQFYFRFIRLDSKNLKRVHFITCDESIEQNLMALVTSKERMNEFVKTGELKDCTEIFTEFDVELSIINEQLRRETDENGNFHISWGDMKLIA